MAMDKLKLQVLMDLADRVSAPLARIGQGSKDAAEHIKAAKDKLKQLEETQRSIGQFREVRTGLTDTEAKLQAARDKVRQLAATYGQLGPPTKEAAAAMAAARNEAAQLGAKFNAQQQQAQRLRDKLSAAGISTKSLADHEKRLRADMTATTAQIQKKTEALKRQREISAKLAELKSRQDAAAAKQAEARGALFDGVALAMGLGAPIKMAMDFESAMADVNKVMDFGDDDNGLKKLSDEALKLSTRLPMAAKEIAAIMALGGQSGLSPAELLGIDGKVGFTEHAIKMGTAFNMTAEEAGTSMAKMKSAFGMSIPEVATLTDKINLLGNTGAANEKQILGILTRVGPLGAVAGVASGEIAALGSTLAGMGVAEEVAATGIQNLMLSLVAGEAATKSQREALKKLGLDSVAVAKGMQKDAAGTMLTVFEKLQGLKDYEQASVMAQLFGKESIKAIAPMLTQLDTLKENFAKVNDETRYSGAVAAEYAARAETSANKLQLAKNKASALSIQLGSVLLPIMVDAVEAVAPWIDRLGALAQAYPGVTKAVLLLTAGLIVGKIAWIAGAYAFSMMRSTLLATKALLLAVRGAWLAKAAVVATVTVASKAFAAAQWLVNAALTANPIGLVIVALAALAGAAYLVYTRWDQIKAGALALWTDLSELGAKFRQIGSDMISGLIEGLTSRLAAVKDAVVGAAQSVSNWFKDTLGIRSPSRVFIEHGGWISEGAAIGIERGQKLAAAAAMGLATATTAPMVQAGQQVAAPPSLATDNGSRLRMPAPAGPMALPAGNTTIHIHAAPGMDPQAVAEAVRRELDKRDRAARSRVYSQLSDME